jgi:hypothetical protein
MRKYIFLLLILIVVTGCGTTMVMNPQTPKYNGAIDFRIKGKIVYQGNREYLPKTIMDDPNSVSALTIRYEYDVTYGRDDVHQALPLFNPLTIIGCPIGEDTLAACGKLEILQGEKSLKSYAACCAFQKTRGLFYEGDTFSELRKKGLLEVRNNIEMQMYQDRDFLMSLR